RRPSAGDVAEQPEYRRLIDGDPPAHQVTQRVGHVIGVRGEAANYTGAVPTAGGGEPQRTGEMVQRHDRLQARRADRLQNRAIVLDRVTVDVAGPGLDARPLN